MQDYFSGEKDPLLDPLIKSYYQSNLDLVRTIGIKSARSALEQNKALVLAFGASAVNQDNVASWKYYQNLGGQYYQPNLTDANGAAWYSAYGLPDDHTGVITDNNNVDHLTVDGVNYLKNGDQYVDNSTGLIYVRSGFYDFDADAVISSWTTWFGGTQAPSVDPAAANAVDGNYYINKTDSSIHRHTNGSWRQWVINNSGVAPVDDLSDGAVNGDIVLYYTTDYSGRILEKTVYVLAGKTSSVIGTYVIVQDDFSTPALVQPKSWDTLIPVLSLDTQQSIIFSTQSLQDNPNTAQQYQFGSRLYRSLVNQYPDQEDLIMGILMPSDIQTAIDAEEGTILRYYKALVEDNEYSLIKNLETFIKLHISRWYVDAFSVTDSYFLMAYYSILYQFMLTKVLNLRHGQCNTYEAHSFHVKVALSGYMEIAKYYNYLTQKQAMYLYRNLPRLVKSMGYNSQFQELIDNLMTERRIAVLGYSVRQTNEINQDFTTKTLIESENLNAVDNLEPSEILSPEQLFDKEKQVLYGTSDFYDVNATAIEEDVSRMNQFKSLTKDIGTKTEQNISIFSLRYVDMILSHWGYMSSTLIPGTQTPYYSAPITFVNPRRVIQQTLTSKDAFIYMYYLSLSYVSESLANQLAIGLPNNVLSKLINFNKFSIPAKMTFIPSFFSKSHVSTEFLTSGNLLAITELDYRLRLKPYADYLISLKVPMSATVTSSAFYQFCLNVFNAYNQQHAVVNGLNHQDERAYGRNMVFRLYQDSIVQLGAQDTSSGGEVIKDQNSQVEEDINSFLARNDLDTYEVLGANFSGLLLNLYNAGTGLDATQYVNSIDVTKAMIAIVKSLVSYNIQFLEPEDKSLVLPVEFEPTMINGRIAEIHPAP